MHKPSRRGFLTGSSVTLAALAGCITAEADPLASSSDQSSEAGDVFDLVPAEPGFDADYRMVVRTSLEAVGNDDELGPEARRVVGAVDDLEVASISRAVTVHFDEHRYRFGAAVGSFDRPEPGEQVEADGDWRIAEDDGLAFASADGKVAFAHGRDGASTGAVEAAVEAARGDADGVLDALDDAEETFTRLDSFDHVFFLPEVEETFPAPWNEQLRAFAAGFETHPADVEKTADAEYLLYPTADADLDDDAVESFLSSIERGQVTELAIDRDDGVVHVEAVVERPPERDRDAAPDARVRAAVDAAEGVVAFEHVGGEPVDAADLELWLDGELAAVQPADEYDTFGPDDVLEVDTGPLADVVLRWFDEDEHVQYVYAEAVVGSDAFEVDYDFDAGTVAFTYVGEREADPEKLRLTHRHDGERTTPDEQFADAHETLTAGDAVTVEDVAVGDRVVLRLDVPPEPGRRSPRLVTFRASPPRVHLRRHPEEGLLAHYRDREERDAGEFRVLGDGEPADVQFEDVQETLSPGDTVELGDAAIGSEVTVEWLRPEDPVVVGDLLVVPRADLDFAYDDAAGRLTVEHRRGDDVDADDLALRVDGELAGVQPADDHDSFGPGDSLAVEVPPFAVVELVWVGDADAERRLGRTVTGRGLLEAAYDPDAETVELVYVGESAADPGRIGVSHWEGRGHRRDEPEPLFEDEYDTLTAGDSVVVDGVGVEDRVMVVLLDGGDDRRVHRPLLRFTARPRRAFTFDRRDGEFVAVYRERVARDADEFRILADGEATAVQPADEHDTLRSGDEIVLGAFPAGTELVVEWVAPDDPVAVREHVVVPEADFEVEHDPEAGTVTVEHAGGNEIDADDLGVVVIPSRREPTGWDDHDTVTEGDATTVEAGEDAHLVLVVYREREVLHHERLDD